MITAMLTMFQSFHQCYVTGYDNRENTYSLFGWLVREEVLLAGLCERKILFRLKIYDRL